MQGADVQEQIKFRQGMNNCEEQSSIIGGEASADIRLTELISHIGRAKHNWLVEEQLRQGKAYPSL